MAPLPPVQASVTRESWWNQALSFSKISVVSSRSQRNTGCRGLRVAGVRRKRRPVILWTDTAREFRARCRARRQDPEGRQTRRSAGRAAYPVRTCGQPEDRCGARTDNSASRPRPRRRDHRVKAAGMTVLASSIWPSNYRIHIRCCGRRRQQKHRPQAADRFNLKTSICCRIAADAASGNNQLSF